MRAVGALFVVAGSTVAADDNRRSISVSRDTVTGAFTVQDGIISTDADAFGHYYSSYNSSGWAYLDVHMNTEVSSVDQHLSFTKSFGYLEGFITCNTIKTFYPNFYSAVFGSSEPGAETIQFIEDNYDWMVEQADKNYLVNDYWYAVKASITQINGVYEGLVDGCPPTSSEAKWSTLDNPTLTHILLINAWGDLYQITAKYFEPGRARGLQRPKQAELGHVHSRVLRESSTFVERCSAIIKLLPNYADVVYGHATWDTYESLGPRIFKHYSFPLMRSGVMGKPYNVYFSSSPALLSSVDDFFTISGYAQLGVIETTNDMLNMDLLDKVVPQSMLSYMRAVISNQLAKDGHNWAELFSEYQSGTYTNQWMVLDLTKFTPAKTPQRGFLTVLEEVPGRVHWEDMTDSLARNNYWPSYNNPYFVDIQQLSGYAAACNLSSAWCYDTAPRANIFRERQSSIQNERGVQQILAYNDFQNDPLSLNDSCNAPACRGDLEPKLINRGPYGALDVKQTTVLNSKRVAGELPIINARLGPTTDQQAPFCWSQIDDSGYSHNGQPDCFDFEWQTILPSAEEETFV